MSGTCLPGVTLENTARTETLPTSMWKQQEGNMCTEHGLNSEAEGLFWSRKVQQTEAGGSVGGLPVSDISIDTRGLKRC